MTAFNTQLNVVEAALGVPSEEQQEAGANSVEVILVIGHQLPFSQGPGAPPVIAKVGSVTYTLEREAAIQFFENGLEAAKGLPETPKTSDLQIASNLSEVETAAERLEQLRADK